jgi:hypothetical protein
MHRSNYIWAEYVEVSGAKKFDLFPVCFGGSDHYLDIRAGHISFCNVGICS